MITDKVPATWQDLQFKVGAILQQCGLITEVEAKLESIRGTVELDVYAKEMMDGREYTIACECKYWKSNIPQSVIHSFRMVLSDLGCNLGYIITTSKFQKGAIAAIEKTNVELLTWEEFQNTFFKTWYANHFCTVLRYEASLKIEYNWVDWFDDLTREDKYIYNDLKNKLGDIDEAISYFPWPMSEKITSDFEIPKLPLYDNLYEGDYYGDLPDDILNETSFEELMLKLVAYSKPIMDQFIALNEKYS